MGGIHVLTVLSENIANCGRIDVPTMRCNHCKQLREAYDAVAELIEAAKDAREMLSLVHDITGKVGTRLTAAIARIGGAA